MLDDDLSTLMGALLARAEAVGAGGWLLTDAELFLMLQLASELGLTLPALALSSAPWTAVFLRLSRRAFIKGHVRHEAEKA